MNAVEIGGRYRLEGRLGSGGMSTVQLAFDTRLERYVAVKLLAEHLADDPTFVSRFQREAMAAAKLVHPNIVQVFDSGLDASTGQHYIVMEYIEGQSCAEILRERHWLPVEEALEVVIEACHGLDYAHRKGVVHRDVKPGNLLRSNDGVVKIADFGIAKGAEQSSITQVGAVLGTAAYLAPEQGRGEEAGPSADIYALGVVTYQMISGRLPFEGASLTELAIKQQQETPARLDELVAGVSTALGDAVEIALQIDPRDRYQSAAEMGRALQDGQAGVAPNLPAATSATRVVSREPRTQVRRAAAPVTSQARRPREPREPRVRREPPLVAAPVRGRRRGLGRLLALLFAVAVVAAIVIAIAVAGSATKTVHDMQVVFHNVQQDVNALNSLVSGNTR
jgi:eukaryotic-like serine/threonine-protein kinase